MAAHKSKAPVSYSLACDRLAEVLDAPTRSAIVAALAASTDFGEALKRLREGMREHRFDTPAGPVTLARVVHHVDRLTRDEGFNVLHDWDGEADKLNEDIIPVDVVTFMLGRAVATESRSFVLAVLLDYYFLYLLALLSLRIWDDGDPGENLARLDALLASLQGPHGSGHAFLGDAETLVHLATSHFEAEEAAYDDLLRRVESLSRDRRVAIALAHAGILASHLRFGFETTYGRDIVKLRNDNEADYPWLLFALRNLLEAFERMPSYGGASRERVVEAIANALTPDPRAMVGKTPGFLASREESLARFRAGFETHRAALLESFETFRPSDEGYSPIAFYFNFAHNVVKGLVVDAALEGRPWQVSFNDLLTGWPGDAARAASCREAATTLMGYAKASPDRIRGQWVPVIAYDVRKGRRAFTDAIRRLG